MNRGEAWGGVQYTRHRLPAVPRTWRSEARPWHALRKRPRVPHLVVRRVRLLRRHRASRRSRRRAASGAILRGSYRVSGAARVPHVLAEPPRPEPSRVFPAQLPRALGLRAGNALAAVRDRGNTALGVRRDAGADAVHGAQLGPVRALPHDARHLLLAP